MDFHALPRRDLQALCKRNGIRANMTNVAMADALGALPAVNGIEEYVKPPVDEPAPAAKPVVKAVAEEEKQGIQSREIIILDDSEGEGEEKDLRRDEDEEYAPVLGLERCGASRRARVDLAVAPAPRRRAAAGKRKTVDAVAPQDLPARPTRPRSQRTAALVVGDKVPRARRTAKMAVSWNTGTQQEKKGEAAQGVVADVQTAVPAPVSPDQRGDYSEETEEAMNQHTEQQTELVEVQDQEDEGDKGVVSEVKTTVPEPVSSEERADGAEEMQETMDPQNELQNELVEEQSQEDEGDTGAVMDIPAPVEEEPPVAEDYTVDSSAKEQEMDVQPLSDDSPVVLGFVEQERSDTFLNDTVLSQGPLDEEMYHSSEETEVVPVSEARPATMESADDAGCVVVEEKEVSTFGVVVQSPVEANVASTEEGLLAEQKEDPVDVVVPSEEEGVVATNETPERSMTMDESVANEASTEEGLLAEQKEDPVDDVVPAEEEGVVATNETPERSVAMDESVEEVSTVENVSQVTVTDDEGAGKERDFTVDLPPVVETAKDEDTISSPLFAGMLDDAIKSLSMDSITVETMHNNSGGEKNNTEPVAVEQEKEEKDVSKSETLGNLSLRKLRVKLKETVAANSIIMEPMVSIDSITLEPTHDNSGGEKNVPELVAVEQENEVNDISNSEALGNLSLRKLRVQLKETVAVHSISVEPTVEHENEVKEGNKSEALGNLSQKKLGVNLKEKVAMGQENEVKQVNKSMALDKLSLRKLRLKLKETLNAHKRTK
ncbi:uncharacterized protein LOC100837655 isoform X2 [Brachypodium distachyon]|uniref:uncharacterized protein LOC100837655 isoform X2 n=1 Tax=Brachypodium distachyon TaxID=15368 RepID=UPI0001D440BE|nr:uncharacterized protein LOC100837655 isoform X2 [Brachypodium distachyon]|eukprot:XP_014751000.1 uncharacterized protein LOC100837655 isoform X2 [Brachypodium distachyon]